MPPLRLSLRAAAQLAGDERAMPRPGGDYGDGRKIFVGGLPFSADEHSIREDFGKFGEIEDVYLPRDKELDRPRGARPSPTHANPNPNPNPNS